MYGHKGFERCSNRNFKMHAISMLKLLALEETQFTSTTMILQRPKTIKRDLQVQDYKMEIVKYHAKRLWTKYKKDNTKIVQFIKILDVLQSKIDYIISFTTPTYKLSFRGQDQTFI